MLRVVTYGSSYAAVAFLATALLLPRLLLQLAAAALRVLSCNRVRCSANGFRWRRCGGAELRGCLCSVCSQHIEADAMSLRCTPCSASCSVASLRMRRREAQPLLVVGDAEIAINVATAAGAGGGCIGGILGRLKLKVKLGGVDAVVSPERLGLVAAAAAPPSAARAAQRPTRSSPPSQVAALLRRVRAIVEIHGVKLVVGGDDARGGHAVGVEIGSAVLHAQSGSVHLTLARTAATSPTLDFLEPTSGLCVYCRGGMPQTAGVPRAWLPIVLIKAFSVKLDADVLTCDVEQPSLRISAGVVITIAAAVAALRGTTTLRSRKKTQAPAATSAAPPTKTASFTATSFGLAINVVVQRPSATLALARGDDFCIRANEIRFERGVEATIDFTTLSPTKPRGAFESGELEEKRLRHNAPPLVQAIVDTLELVAADCPIVTCVALDAALLRGVDSAVDAAAYARDPDDAAAFAARPLAPPPRAHVLQLRAPKLHGRLRAGLPLGAMLDDLAKSIKAMKLALPLVLGGGAAAVPPRSATTASSPWVLCLDVAVAQEVLAVFESDTPGVALLTVAASAARVVLTVDSMKHGKAALRSRLVEIDTRTATTTPPLDAFGAMVGFDIAVAVETLDVSVGANDDAHAAPFVRIEEGRGALELTIASLRPTGDATLAAMKAVPIADAEVLALADVVAPQLPWSPNSRDALRVAGERSGTKVFYESAIVGRRVGVALDRGTITTLGTSFGAPFKRYFAPPPSAAGTTPFRWPLASHDTMRRVLHGRIVCVATERCTLALRARSGLSAEAATLTLATTQRASLALRDGALAFRAEGPLTATPSGAGWEGRLAAAEKRADKVGPPLPVRSGRGDGLTPAAAAAAAATATPALTPRSSRRTRAASAAAVLTPSAQQHNPRRAVLLAKLQCGKISQAEFDHLAPLVAFDDDENAAAKHSSGRSVDGVSTAGGQGLAVEMTSMASVPAAVPPALPPHLRHRRHRAAGAAPLLVAPALTLEMRYGWRCVGDAQQHYLVGRSA